MLKHQVIKKLSKYEGKKRGRKPGQTAAAIKAQAIEKQAKVELVAPFAPLVKTRGRKSNAQKQ